MRAALRATGYNGEKVVILNPADSPALAPLGPVTADLLQRAGLNVDLQDMDWGTLLQRRMSKAAPEAGGWSIFHSTWPSIAIANPVLNTTIRGEGATGWPGWFESAEMERLTAAWLDATAEPERQRLQDAIHELALREVPTLPLGVYFPHTAYRTELAERARRLSALSLERAAGISITHLVGTVSSAARVLPALNGRTLTVARSEGAYLWDTEGRRYVDTALGFGGTVLGHAPPAVVEAAAAALRAGPLPAFAHAGEETAAAAIAAHTAPLDKVLFVSTGGEAVHLACRAARVATGRARIAKMAGGFDGWLDDVAFGAAGAPEAAFPGNARPETDRSRCCASTTPRTRSASSPSTTTSRQCWSSPCWPMPAASCRRPAIWLVCRNSRAATAPSSSWMRC